MAHDRDAQIRDKAYRLWQQEGEPHGRDREHWEQAEREFTGEGPADGPDPQAAGDDNTDPQIAIHAEAPAAPEQPVSAPEPAPAPAPTTKTAAKKPATRRKRTT